MPSNCFHIYTLSCSIEMQIWKHFLNMKSPISSINIRSWKSSFWQKSDLLNILTESIDHNEPPSSFDIKVLDGAAVLFNQNVLVHLMTMPKISPFLI